MGCRKHGVESRVAKAGAILFWIVAWQLTSMAAGSEFVLAGPLDAVAALAHLLPSAEFWRSVTFSLVRIVGGCAFAYLVAVPLALAAASHPTVRTLLQPAMGAIKGTPIACTVVALLIWFGSGNISAIAVGLAVLPVVYFGVLQGADRADPRMSDLFRAFGTPVPVRLLAHTWPQILPYLRAASQSALGMSWKAGVAAELIGVPTGSIGERIYQAKLLLETADLFAWTIAVIVLAWACELVALRALDSSWPAFASLALQFRRRASDQPRPSGTFAHAGAPVFSATSLVCGHDGALACGPFDLALCPGDIACAEGPSGAGKTTLLDTIAGELAPLSGEAVRKATTVARVYQDTRLVEDLSAIDNLLLVTPADFSSSNARERLEELLPADAADVPVKRLSGGQRRRVELARAFAAPSDLVLLDEPFTGLDPRARDLARAHILSHMHGKAVLISAHDASELSLPFSKTVPAETSRPLS